MVAGVYLDSECLNDLESFSWGLSEGVQPMTASILMLRSQAVSLLAKAKAAYNSGYPFMTLTKGTDVFGQSNLIETFSNVVITGYRPSTFEPQNFVYLNIADSRHFWDRGYFQASFNVRTAVGDKTSIDEVFVDTLGTVPREIIDRISYRSYSMYPPIRERLTYNVLTPWTIPQIIHEVIRGFSTQSMRNTYSFSVSYEIPAPLKTALESQLYEGIHLNGSHRAVLSQILSYVPHVGIYVDKEGTIKFYDKNNGGEEGIINRLPTPLDTDGISEFVFNDLEIPRKIHFIFDIQSELRFDFEEAEEGSAVPELEARTMTMVAPVPLPTLFIGTKTDLLDTGYTALSSQIIEFDNIISALQRDYPDIPLTKALFRRNYCFQGVIEKMVYEGKVKYSTVNWDEIVSTLMACYRKMFRINGNWQSKMVGMIARRATIFDPTTGTLAPSPVFLDYAYWISTRGIFNQGAEFNTFIKNVTNWSDADYKVNDAVPVGSAFVDMRDAENGIFSISMDSYDPIGHFKKILPSTVVNPPSYDLGDGDTPNLADEAAENDSEAFLALSPNHKMSIIISATPAPHPGQVRFIITLTPSDVSSIVPLTSLTGAAGHEMWVKVPASVDMARIRWKDGDDYQLAFEQLFGVGRRDTTELFPELLVTQIINRNYLKDIAKAMGASIWAKYVHRYRGSQSSEFVTDLEPNGSISTILHTMNSNGLLSTRISPEENLDVPSWENLLTPQTRAFIFGQVKKDS